MKELEVLINFLLTGVQWIMKYLLLVLDTSTRTKLANCIYYSIDYKFLRVPCYMVLALYLTTFHIEDTLISYLEKITLY